MKPVTYAQLDKALKALGFSIKIVTVENKLRVYDHEESGARFWLAYLPDDEPVVPHHMAVVEGKLRIHGIADPLDFLMGLQKAS